MSDRRPRIILLYKAASLTDGDLTGYAAIGEVETRHNLSELASITDSDNTLVVMPLDRIPPAVRGGMIEGAELILHHLGDGVAVVNDDGELTWYDDRMGSFDIEIRQRVVERCRYAFDLFNGENARGTPIFERRSIKLAFTCGPAHYELVVTPATGAPDDPLYVNRVVGVLWEVTASRRLQAKIDAIDAAGSELMNIKASSLAGKSIAERLQLLEGKIVHVVHELLNFDNFEVRLLNRETNQLELVIQIGLTPMKIGEGVFAERDGNGISGYVAATGEAYLCSDSSKDPLYRVGLDDPGSSLTVPLRLHDQVIGTFNVESNQLNQFDENDLQFAEIFGRYIAASMNILDLLIVERYTTNEQVAQNVIGELSDPLNEITSQAITLQSKLDDTQGELRDELDRIVRTAESMRRRIEACTSGPRTILGAEREMNVDTAPEPALFGKRVLVADDEPVIRDTLTRILSKKGCIVETCKDGMEAISALEASSENLFDLVISDIRMPSRTGYEVFKASRAASGTTKVILMTGFGYDPHHSIVRATQEGLHSFLFKPFKVDQMLDAVRDALADA
jgi:CheY-like chemotaxis protein